MLEKLFNEVMAAPLGNLISSIAEGVGEAQAALDAGSLKQTLEIYTSSSNKSESLELLKKIGYRPTFYVLPETEVTTTVSMTISGSDVDISQLVTPKLAPTKILLASRRLKSYVAPVNATNANKYNIDINAATTLKFKIVPVPTPVYVENAINDDEVDELLSSK
jgi:hypothetical protein